MGKGVALIQDMGHRMVSAALIASQMQPYGSMQLPRGDFNPALALAGAGFGGDTVTSTNRQTFIGVQHLHVDNPTSRAAADEWADAFTR